MPLFFSIGSQGALEELVTSFAPWEHLCAFLDDYLQCLPERVVLFNRLLSEALARVGGIRLHQGRKPRCGTRPKECQRTSQELGPEDWRPQGLKILGTPIGTPVFVSQKMNDRIEDERRFWGTIPSVPDLRCAWQLLVQSANPRTNHRLRTMPPSCTSEYARVHDQGMWQTVETLFQTPGTDAERAIARELATLPVRTGGLGLRSATLCVESEFWASWADALPMFSERTPSVADMMVPAMVGDQQRGSSRRLDWEGFLWRPSWPELLRGKRPPQNTAGEPGE